MVAPPRNRISPPINWSDRRFMPSSPTMWSDCLGFTSTRDHFAADQLFGLLDAGFLANQPVELSIPSLLVTLEARLLGWRLFGVRILRANVAS